MLRCPAFAGLLVVCGCNQIFGLDAPGDDLADDDGDDGGGDDGGPRRWGVPHTIAVAATPGVLEDDPVLAPSGKELFFSVLSIAGGDEDIVVSAMAAMDWQTPVPSGLGATAATDTTLRLAGDDDLVAYFASNRLGGALHIFSANRSGTEPFTNPVPVVALNSGAEDSAAAPCAESGRFVVASTRGGASSDLYDVSGLGANPIPSVNTASNETGPFLTADCLRLYYASNQHGTFDLYVVSRAAVDTEWGEPAMIEELSTSSNEGDPWLSPDEDHILFASDALGDTDVVEAFR